VLSGLGNISGTIPPGAATTVYINIGTLQPIAKTITVNIGDVVTAVANNKAAANDPWTKFYLGYITRNLKSEWDGGLFGASYKKQKNSLLEQVSIAYQNLNPTQKAAFLALKPQIAAIYVEPNRFFNFPNHIRWSAAEDLLNQIQ
jgi:hypothetical protein